MRYAVTPDIVAALQALATDPVTLLWASGWAAAALGFWLRAALPPLPEDDTDLAVALAFCAM